MRKKQNGKPNAKPTAKSWIKFAVVLLLYLAFLYWVESWLGLIVVPFIFDA